MTRPGHIKGPMMRPSKTCPICRRPSEARWRPFCSRRCSEVDLFRWLNGSYRVPAASAAEEGDGTEAAEYGRDED